MLLILLIRDLFGTYNISHMSCHGLGRRLISPVLPSIPSNLNLHTSFRIHSNINSTYSHSFVTSNRKIHDNTGNFRDRVVGQQPPQNLKVGPYKRGRWFVSYKDDPGSFITNILIIIVTAYSIFTLTPGESMKTRRQRKLRQLLLEKADLTEAELNYIENYDFVNKANDKK